MCDVEIRKAGADDVPSIHDLAQIAWSSFYRHLGMTVLRQGDFHIGNGFYMNDYIMGLDL